MGSNISWQDTGDGGARVALAGRLTIDDVARLSDELGAIPPRAPGLTIDLAQVSAIDTAGAWAINSLMGRWQQAGLTARIDGAAPEIDRLIRALTVPPPPVKRRADIGNPIVARLERIGKAVVHQADNAGGFLAFLGQTLVVLASTLIGRRHLRWHAVVHQGEAIGVNALGIVGLLL
ncbi:STAS domain-containing protein, partial [Sandarakinorhabdus sp.]|uniref:STAS domain-containing protein n=1 Tax=Sandarakinorhabdus sp. TaxID=1916663 RepID=UPI00286D98C2